MTTCSVAGERMYDLWLFDSAYACLAWPDSHAKLMAVPVYTSQGHVALQQCSLAGGADMSEARMAPSRMPGRSSQAQASTWRRDSGAA